MTKSLNDQINEVAERVAAAIHVGWHVDAETEDVPIIASEIRPFARQLIERCRRDVYQGFDRDVHTFLGRAFDALLAEITEQEAPDAH